MYNSRAALMAIRDDIEESRITHKAQLEQAVSTVLINHVSTAMEARGHVAEHLQLVKHALTNVAAGDLHNFNDNLDQLPIKVLKDLHSIRLTPPGLSILIKNKKIKPVIENKLKTQTRALEKALRTRPERRLVDQIKALKLASTSEAKAHEIPGLLHVTDNALVFLFTSKLTHLPAAQREQLTKELSILIRNKNGVIKGVHVFDLIPKVKVALGKLSQENHAKLRREVNSLIDKARLDAIEMTAAHPLVKEAIFDSSRHLEKTFRDAFAPAVKRPVPFKWKTKSLART